MWRGLHELKTCLSPHTPASQALSTSTVMANSHAFSPQPPSLCPSPPQPLAPLALCPLALPASHQSTLGCLCFALSKVQADINRSMQSSSPESCQQEHCRSCWASLPAYIIRGGELHNKECKPMLRDDQGCQIKSLF